MTFAFQLLREVRGPMRQSELLRIIEEMQKTPVSERISRLSFDSKKRKPSKARTASLSHR